MKWLKSFFVTTCALAFSFSHAYAQDDFIKKINLLYDSGQINEAYGLAEKHLLEAEGDLSFDYIYGLSAIDSGHFSQGVFALERVLMLRPDDQRARLELARGYFLLEQYDRARVEFTKVLETNPPADVKVTINKFMDGIRQGESNYKSSAGFYVELGFGSDTNVNSSPSSANFDSPTLGPGTLNDSSVSIEDNYYRYAVGANVNHPLKTGIALFGEMSTSHKSFEDTSEFNLGSITLQSGFIFSGERHRLKMGLQWQDFEVGDESYRELMALNSDLRWKLNKQTMISGFAQVADMTFEQNKSRDSQQLMAGLGFQHAFSGPYRPFLFASLYGGGERSKEETITAETLVDRDIYGFSVGTQFTITPQIDLIFTGMMQQNGYRNEDVFFLKEREDSYSNLSAKTTWKPYRDWSVSVNMSYTENQSNIAIYRYTRTQTGMTIRYDY
jgi:tetratricopeptide (TPR) repeat protein